MNSVALSALFPLPALQFALYGFADHVSHLLAFGQGGLHAGFSSIRESGGDLFEIYLRSAHFI